MKLLKLKKWICAALIAVLAAAPSCIAASARSIDLPTFTAADGAETVLYYENGSAERRSGYPAAGSLGALAGVVSYEVYIDGSPVFTVGIADAQSGSMVGAQGILNGYYTLDVNLSGKRSLFCTGLSKSSLSTYQTLIVRKYNHKADFSYEDAGFIDAEKSALKHNDDNLCWAAQASNSLHYTGWGALAGFQTTDDIFDAFADAFIDQGGYEELAYSWFFNGVYAVPEGMDGLYPGMKKDESGGYLNDYCADTVYTVYDVTEYTPEAFHSLEDALRGGKGVGLGVHWWEDGMPVGGHAITCWGVIVNNAYEDTDMRHYEALIISDSDSDEQYLADRRKAPNAYTVVCLEPNSREDAPYETCYWLNNYSENCFLTDFSALDRAEDALKETDPMATKNKKTTADLWTQGAMLYDQTHYEGMMEALPTVRDIHVSPYLYNASDIDIETRLACSVTVTDSSGGTVYDGTRLFYYQLASFEARESEDFVNLGRLPAGEYTVSITANSKQAFSEAYFLNNTVEFTMLVEDMPFGDMNCDGQVNIADATRIQAWEVSDEELSDEMMFLADVNGDGEVNVVDATAVQKYCAGYPVVLGECTE